MKNTTQRDQADTETEKIKSVLKLTGLDYFIEESPFRLTIHVKKSYIQDFSPLLCGTSLPTSSSPVRPLFSPQVDNRQLDEIDSGLLSHESVLCSSCDYNNQQLEDVRKELVKVLLQSNQNSDKAKIDLEQANASLFECQNKLKH